MLNLFLYYLEMDKRLKTITGYVGILVTVMMLFACSGENEKHKEQSPRIIVDDAGVVSFSPEIRNQYREYNDALLEDFDVDFRVITTESGEDLNSFTNSAFDIFQRESRSRSGKAILLVINTHLDEARMGVSMALEPIYTDFFISYIERKGMVPYFRASRVADGVYMMMELVRDRAFEAEQGMEFMEPMETKSLGGGALNDALIGQIDPKAKEGENITTDTNDTPEIILVKHLWALKSHNKNPNLEIYSQATQDFFQNWTVTDINQENEFRFISQCRDGKVHYSTDGMRAILLHPLKQRTCCPYYFVKEQDKWRLDIATMAKVLRFNKEMDWHFSPKDREQYNVPYEYVFGGFDYDRNGYPYARNVKQEKKTRWGYRCSGYSLPGDQPEKVRCQINWLQEHGAAKNELGLEVNDVIVGVGDAEDHIKDPNLFKTAYYFRSIAPGELATLIVAREGLNRQKLQGVAP